MKLRRRDLLGVAGASVALARSLQAQMAHAAATSAAAVPHSAEVLASVAAKLPRGAKGRLARLATLDLESQQDFTAGFRVLHAGKLREAAYAEFDRILEREGHDPAEPMTVEQVRALVEKEPSVYVLARSWLSNQQITWKTLQTHFHDHADHYLSQLAAADREGPGKLEMPADMEVPQYARHEIHIQPGGYVGDPFAGYIYHYGTLSFYAGVRGQNFQDDVQRAVASRFPLPPDGRVRRVLDLGCAAGQLTCALKERFPQAEVWGIDVGAPMVRYAHLRANQLGVGANFVHGLAEDTRFPDGYFDIVLSRILHHELPADRTLAVIDEARRVTRAGGVFYPLDFASGGLRSNPRAMFNRWWDHRWNNEVWSLEYHALDFTAEIAVRGFRQDKTSPALTTGYGHRHFVRTA